jgi:hypothetical protein
VFKKKPEENYEIFDIQAELKEMLNSEEDNLQLDFESFRRRIQPAIHQKTMEIQEGKRRRREVIQLAIAYGIIIILAPLLILDFWVNGWQGRSLGAVLFILIFSLLMIGCSPLLVKFKKN